MCCQIVARKSVAPSSSNFRRPPAPRYVCGQGQEFWRKKSFSKITITPLPRPWPDFRDCVTSMIFQGLLVFLLGGLGWGVPNWKSDPHFFFKKKILQHHGDLWSTGKVLSSQKVLLWMFPEIRNLFWRYAELNRLLVGTGQIPLNIELQQDKRTVCCSHKIVTWMLVHIQHYLVQTVKLKHRA